MTDENRHLLVDDEPIQRLIVARAVESLGSVVDSAADLDDAVVLDLSLAANEGISLLHALREQGTDPVVVMVSGMDARCVPPAFAWPTRWGSGSPGRWKSQLCSRGCGRSA